MPNWKDEHGQPHPVFRVRQNVDRSMDELIGLCKGMAADGRVNQEEATYLCRWLKANQQLRDAWPANVLRIRLAEYLEDGTLDADEKAELFDLLCRTGGVAGDDAPVNYSSTLPFDSPLPALLFHGRRFCLTGTFHTGTRPTCEKLIESLGGQISNTPAQKGCILVVGVFGSRDWMHSTHGRKIERAVELRSQGHPVAIVPEYHWYDEVRKELNLR